MNNSPDFISTTLRILKKNQYFLTVLLFTNALFSNNLSITNFKIVGSDTVNKFTFVQFDISWENSWRSSITPAPPAPPNWDAAWVFIKYKESGGTWKQAWLNNTGHTAPTGSTINIGLIDPSTAFNSSSNPGVGAFIYRDADGTGIFSKTNVRLRWNYGANGLNNLSIVDAQIYGIEMVYIPQASFYLGSGGTESSCFTDGSWPADTLPYHITTEDEIIMDSVPGSLFAINAINSLYPGVTRPVTLPALFPKGYKAFYCMKHAITQQGYVNFLNTLTRTQQNTCTRTNLHDTIVSVTNRYVMRNSSTFNHRQAIRCDAIIAASVPITFYCDQDQDGIGGEDNDGLGIICNWISWWDVLAYLDWAGLRPLSELEYEKTLRGDQVPVANEFPWGNATVPTNALGPDSSGYVDEVPSNAGANQNYNRGGGTGVYGTTRAGSFATSSSTREQAGAGYYGTLDFGCSTYQPVVPVSKINARLFIGDHGDGLIDVAGYGDTPSWPGTAGTGNTSTADRGYGHRGSSWWTGSANVRISYRGIATNGSHNDYARRWDSIGGRGGRTAP